VVKNDAKLALVALGHRHLSGSEGPIGSAARQRARDWSPLTMGGQTLMKFYSQTDGSPRAYQTAGSLSMTHWSALHSIRLEGSRVFLIFAQLTRRRESDVYPMTLTNSPKTWYIAIDRTRTQTLRRLHARSTIRRSYHVVEKEEDYDSHPATAW
jgi:hypothetical protein